MRFASLASSLLALLGGIAAAAEGDALVVTGDGVNVRARPQSGAPVLLQVHRTEPALELTREGDWVQVRLPDHDTMGWIHGSLLATSGGEAPPGAAADRASVPPSDSPPAAVAPASPAPQPATAAGSAATERAEATPRGAPQLAAGGAPNATALARFRDSVEYLNTRALAVAGVNLFTDVSMAGDDVAQITATDAWGVVPEGGRESYMNALYDRWLATVGSPLARLQIVDESGQVLSERYGP